jgi:hypothetical protein
MMAIFTEREEYIVKLLEGAKPVPNREIIRELLDSLRTTRIKLARAVDYIEFRSGPISLLEDLKSSEKRSKK